MTDATDRLTECFKMVFPQVPVTEIPDLKVDGDVWDSLATVSLITVVEDEFEVRFDDDKIEGLTSFAAFHDALA
ncbi:MAG: acyl carrier protein [Actinomycetota bacterium]|nr:acyl carrier protein [Actinomycetota bacterium]